MDEEEERFDVVLLSAGERKVSVVKLVREMISLDLAEAKAFVESVPQTVKKDLPLDEALALQGRFEALGAYVELRSLGD